jgi:hypothetical protein
VVGIRLGERCQARSIEADAVVVDEVRILARVHPACAEPYLALGLVHVDHVADHPVALRDLVLDAPRRPVEQVKVIPAVPLRHPDHFFSIGDVETVLLPE